MRFVLAALSRPVTVVVALIALALFAYIAVQRMPVDIFPKVGEPARIIDGPFKGVEGLVTKTDYEKELFVIAIELLQRSVAIKLEGFQIARL